MMSLFPAVLLIAAAASLLFYEINQSLAQQIEEELGLRKNAGIQKQVGVE
jgi:Na+/melibiose symporter-like transporter